jgi:hypothetical protein
VLRERYRIRVRACGKSLFYFIASLRNGPSNGFQLENLSEPGNCFVIARLIGIGKSSGCKHEC